MADSEAGRPRPDAAREPGLQRRLYPNLPLGHRGRLLDVLPVPILPRCKAGIGTAWLCNSSHGRISSVWMDPLRRGLLPSLALHSNLGGWVVEELVRAFVSV